MAGKKWTVAEESIVRELYPVSTIAELMEKLPGRSWGAIYNRAYVLEVEKDIAFLKSEKCGRFHNGTNNAATQFKKGNVPFNKGMKGVFFGGKETQFKKGSVPANTLYDGAITERYHKSGNYMYIRVDGRWELLQRHVWQTEKGPIPPNHVIGFKDRDYKNCSIENLECFSRKENMTRNSIARYPEDIRKAIHTVAKLQRIITKKENA